MNEDAIEGMRDRLKRLEAETRTLRRLELLEQVDTSRMRATLTITLQDDNVGHLPQVATENLAVLLNASSRQGWEGFYTRHWAIGDLDPVVTWLAQASWDARITPRDAYVDHISHVYGRDSVDLFCQVLRLLEDATVILDLHLGPLFPVHDVMRSWLQRSEPVAQDFCHVMAIYESVRGLLNRIRAQDAGPPSKATNLDYWMSRLEFSIHALHEFRLLQEAGTAFAGDSTADRQHGIELQCKLSGTPARRCAPCQARCATTPTAARWPRTTSLCCAKWSSRSKRHRAKTHPTGINVVCDA